MKFMRSKFVHGAPITLCRGVETFSVLALEQWVLKSAHLFYHMHGKKYYAIYKNVICNAIPESKSSKLAPSINSTVTAKVLYANN